jgi:DNA-binding CsgD family transcriptional regulator
VPGNLELWCDALGAINHLVGAQAAAYMWVNAEDQRAEVLATSGFDDEVVRRYEGPEGFPKDVRAQYWGNLVPGLAFREFEYVPDRAAYDASEWIRWQYEATGLYWCMSANVGMQGLWHDYLSVNRLHVRGPHTDAEKTRMNALLPHLSRACELHRLVSRLEERYGAVLAALDKFLVGLVLLDVKGRIVVANRAARMACEATGLLTLRSDGRIRAHDASDDASLQAMITRSSLTAHAGDQFDGGTLVLRKPGSSKTLLLEIMPVRDDGFVDNDHLRGAAVFVLEPTLRCRFSVDGLSKIFALTGSERSVAAMLVNGTDVSEIAETRGTSTETVRSQLKSILSKTGVRSQVDLVRLAAKANPPIAES